MALGKLGRRGGVGSLGSLRRVGNGGPPVPQNFFTSDGSSWGFEQLATAPSAVYDSATNKTWQTWESYADGFKNFKVAVYDHTAGTWSDTYMVGNIALTGDDHGLPALCKDSDGYWWVFCGPHNQTMRYYRSRLPNDPSAGWLAQNEISGDLQSSYTYAHPTFLGGKIYLFMREFNSSSNWASLNVRVGTVTSGSVSWGANTVILGWTACRCYQGNHIVVGNEIQIIMSQADIADTLRKDVFLFRYDTTTGNLVNWDSSVTVTPASFPYSLANSQTNFRIVNQTGGSTQGFIPAWCYDTAGNPHIVYMDGSNGGIGGPYSLLHIKWTGSAWTSPFTVGSFTGNAVDNHRYDAYTIVPQPSGAVKVFWPKNNSTFSRGSGTISARTRDNAGSWNTESDFLTAAGSYALDAPLMVRDGVAGYRLAITETTGLATTFPSPGTKVYAFSDTGPVQRVPATARQYHMASDMLFGRMDVAPSSARAAVYDALIRGLISDGIYDLLDAIYLLKAHDRQAARLNVVRSGWDLTETDSANLTFVTDSHFVGNGTSSRLYCSTIIPSVLQNYPNSLPTLSMLRYNVNEAHVWGVTNNLGDAGTAFGFGDPTAFRVAIANINATQLLTRLNRETPTTTITLGTNGGIGFAGVSRQTSPGGIVNYNVNGTQNTVSQGATGLPTAGFGVCGQSNTGFSNRQMRAAGFGGGLTGPQLELLRVRVNTYLTAF